MFNYLRSLVKPENPYVRTLSRVRVVTDLILILITIFIFFQLKYFFTSSGPEPYYADSFNDFSMIVYTMSGLKNPVFYQADHAIAFSNDTKIINLSVNSGFDYFLLNSKYLVLLILLLVVFYKIRKFILSLDRNKSFSKQLMGGLKNISRIIICFAIVYIFVSVFNRTYCHWYFEDFFSKSKIDGFALAPYKLLAIDIIIAVFILLLGILLNVMSKFFSLGLALQEENDLTV
jgi:hypothetical protein